MSSAIDVYAIPLEKLQQALGSRSQELFDAVVADNEYFLSSVDQIAADQADDEDDDAQDDQEDEDVEDSDESSDEESDEDSDEESDDEDDDEVSDDEQDDEESDEEPEDDSAMTCADALADLINGETTDGAPGYLYGYALQAICSHLGQALDPIDQIAGFSDWMEKIDNVLEKKRIPARLMALVFGGSPVDIPEPEDNPYIGHWPPDLIAASLPALQSASLDGLDHDTTETLITLRSWLESAAKTPGASLIGFLS